MNKAIIKRETGTILGPFFEIEMSGENRGPSTDRGLEIEEVIVKMCECFGLDINIDILEAEMKERSLKFINMDGDTRSTLMEA